MKITIVGSGVIGLTYGWLLSQRHDIRFLRKGSWQQTETLLLELEDLRQQKCPGRLTPAFRPNFGGHPAPDLVLVTLPRHQLQSALPAIARYAGGCEILFLLNHWSLGGALAPHLMPHQYHIGFPGAVGGGRSGGGIQAILFPQGTRLAKSSRGSLAEKAFLEANIPLSYEKNISAWLKVHYLQQSVTAGALAKTGSYTALCQSSAAFREMALAFREGLQVCRATGENIAFTHPAPLFRLPLPLIAASLQKMFNAPTTRSMIEGHMRHGLPEWLAGYHEVLHTGHLAGIPMPVWQGYLPYLPCKK